MLTPHNLGNHTPRTYRIGIVAVFFVIIHGALFSYGVSQPESFLAGDRADTRFATIEYVFADRLSANSPAPAMPDTSADSFESKSSVLKRMMAAGHPGDYAIQGAILSISNQHVLVALQLALSFAAALCIFRLTNLLTKSTRLGTAAILVYLILPGSLVQPHQLVSEALFNPLVAIAAYFLFAAIEGDFARRPFLAGLLTLSVAIFVRPQLMLFPLVLSLIIVVFRGRNWRVHVLTAISVPLLFVGLWAAFVIAVHGEPSVGGNDRSIGIAFYKTVERMSDAGYFDLELDAYPDKTIPTADFIKIVFDNPIIYTRQRLTGTINYLVNPGMYSLAAHHLRIIDGHGNTTFWGEMRDRSGIVGTITQIISRGPLFVILILGSTLIWGLILLLAFVGLFPFLKSREIPSAAKAMLAGLVVYQTAIVMALSVYGRWQQRTPIDFVIIILFVFGVQYVAKWVASRGVIASS